MFNACWKCTIKVNTKKTFKSAPPTSSLSSQPLQHTPTQLTVPACTSHHILYSDYVWNTLDVLSSEPLISRPPSGLRATPCTLLV